MTIGKKIYRSGPLKDFFAQGVKVGDVLYLAGQVGIDASGKPGADIVEQTKLECRNRFWCKSRSVWCDTRSKPNPNSGFCLSAAQVET